MCGVLYSKNSKGFSDLEMLKKRGPEGFKELENNLGYFAHSMLNTIGESTLQPFQTNSGILLYNGSTYNSGKTNDTQWIGEKLDENLSNTLDVVRELNGEYAFIYVTEKNVVFCVDHFDCRNLWMYHDKHTRELTLSSVPNIVHQKHKASWRVSGNKIYVVDRHNFNIFVETNKVFDLDQKTNHFDHVFENFERAIKQRYNPENSTCLLSSGFDSGVVNCATFKIFKEIDCVCDPKKEIKSVIKERMNVHRVAIMPTINYDNLVEQKRKMWHGLLAKSRLWQDPVVEATTNIYENYIVKRNKKIVITGTGGDEIYNDYQLQHSGFMWTKTNGSFPSSLQLVWPWHNYDARLQLINTRVDFIAGYHGLEARMPLLDINLVQAWLNTTPKRKNSYKAWMKAYMDEEKYPYTMEKCHWAMDKMSHEPWQLTKEDANKYFAS